jgi:heat shock protein HslJ
MMKLYMAGVIGMCMTLAAFPETGAEPPGLENVTWRVTEINGVAVTLDNPPRLTIVGSKASGFTGCNSFSAVATVVDAGVNFRDISSTRMACKGDAGATEKAFLAALGGMVVSYTQEGAVLKLRESGGEPVIVLTSP